MPDEIDLAQEREHIATTSALNTGDHAAPAGGRVD